TSASPVGTYPITVTAGSLAATNYTFTFVNGTLTVTAAVPTAAPVVTSAATATGTYGTSGFSYSFTASQSPTSYSVTGTLPNGLTLNTSSGVISGTPTQSGLFTVTIGATNSIGTGTASLAITINKAVLTVTANGVSIALGA